MKRRVGDGIRGPSTGSQKGSTPTFAVRSSIWRTARNSSCRAIRWPRHLFIVVGLHGSADAQLEDRAFVLRAQSHLVVLPGASCTVRARSPASVEVISLLSTPPGSTG